MSGYIKNLLTIQRAERKAEFDADRGKKQLEKEYEYEELSNLLNSSSEYPSAYSGKVHCSFCNKSEDECTKLIVGHNNVMICDKCIDVCVEILGEVMDEEK